ncbi:TIGR04283 family arsenosugar biosynthesis glycosyltransferase [Tateyamaria sp. syn59]|uniref:TIGR04283 family arsenosugar biosynthesis glycosyltransferase n=1 Tax=Tateyamaria sp. syn59 TaxID=2576942 RepID=UPI0011BF0A3C|nr:TIGR04283 family arsenosugar biosynthesis glycosyltransferase [Tateyamaria sp. syn59]
MPAPISVIIPTLNAEAALGPCLAALMEGVDAGLIAELIVSDGGSDDRTVALADAWGAQIVRGLASRGGQLRRGTTAARAEWFLILHADTCLTPGWTAPVAEHLGRAHAGYFNLRFDRGGQLVAAWANLRARLFGLPYGDQGLLIRRDHYVRVGGYPDIPLMEDVAIARALRGALVPLDAVAVTSAEKYRRQGWLRRGTRNLWTLLRYFAGVSPERLAESYRR